MPELNCPKEDHWFGMDRKSMSILVNLSRAAGSSICPAVEIEKWACSSFEGRELFPI